MQKSFYVLFARPTIKYKYHKQILPEKGTEKVKCGNAEVQKYKVEIEKVKI